MDYREDRFDTFGFESPFSPGGTQGNKSTDEPFDWIGETSQEESLAWLDLESEWVTPLFEEEDRRTSRPRIVPMALHGGQLWSSTDPKLRVKQAIFVSPAALNQRQVEVLFYVHGLLGPCGGRPRGGMAGLIAEAKFALGASVAASRRATILIVPQFQDDGDASWFTHGLARPAELNAYIDRRMAEVGTQLNSNVPTASGLIVAGHSKAYEVLYRLAASHASPALSQGSLASLSDLWLLDASYGHFPHQAMAALLEAKPTLSIKQIYRAGSMTDKFGGKQSDGRLAFIPVPKAIGHCAIPARCLPDLLANRPVSAMAASPAREDYALDFASEDEDLFELEDEEYAWNETLDEYEGLEQDEEEFGRDMEGMEPESEAEHRCNHDEALFEGIGPFMESENWSSATDQVAFRERVLAEHIRRTEKRKKQLAQPDLRDDQLATIPGTKIKTRTDTAIAAGILLSAANVALAAAKATGDASAAKIRNISVTSGYRSASRQLNLWRGVFSAQGGYYDTTEAKRQSLPGGPHSDAAIAYLLKSTSNGGFGLGGRIAAPGFSNHQSGAALDFVVNLEGGGSIKLSSKDRYRAIWRASWFHKWMLANAQKFGFHPIPTEEWHWEYRPGKLQSEVFDAEDELFENLLDAENETFDESFDYDQEQENWQAEDEHLDEELTEKEGPIVAFADLAPEPFRISGGHYNKDQKKHAATHPAGLLLTVPAVVGPQEKKLVAMAPYPITVGKELTRFEDGKIGVWLADYNAFTHDFEEVLRAMGRMRDLLSAGSPEAPTDLTPLQKRSFKPTDDSSATFHIKTQYMVWRNAQKDYDATLLAIVQSEREIGRRRKDFWVAQGKLLRSIAQARRLKKPEYEDIDLRLSDLVSVATAGTLSLGVLTGAALLGDWIIEARNKRDEYFKKVKEFRRTTKESNDDVRDNLDAFQNAGERYWEHVNTLQDQFRGLKGREIARGNARLAAAHFAQAIPPKSMKDDASLASIRMPAQVATEWRTLAIVGPRALALMISLRRRWPIVERAVSRFRYRPDPLGLEDATQLALAAKRAQSWSTVLTKDDVEEWVAMNRLWDDAYAKFYR